MTLPAIDLPSAKNMTIDTAVSSFVPTPMFWEILQADSHDVLFGTRGSGKTMLLRMLSLQHLHAFAQHDEDARKAIYDDKRFGLFLPLGLDWCVAYQDDTPDTFQLFLDGVNLVAADCLLEALDLLIRADILHIESRTALERTLAERLSKFWFREEYGVTYSLADLRDSLLCHQTILRDVWRGRVQAPSTERLTKEGFHFRSSPTLLRPLADAVRIANPLLGLPEDHRWIVCLDELEDLKERQTQAVATMLRGVIKPLTIKITTLPYTMESTETAFSPQASAISFRDYEIRRLQHDPSDRGYRDLVASILRKRIKAEPDISGERLAERIFGTSRLSARADEVGHGFKAVRARLAFAAENPDSLRQKIPVLALRYLRRSAEGHVGSVAYAGWDTIVRASDGNPGMFVRILNAFGLDPENADEIEPSRQHETLTRLAGNWHAWSVALYSSGENLHRVIEELGTLLSQQLHDRKVSDDQVSFEVNRFLIDLTDVDEATAEALKVGARHSLFVAETLDGSVSYPQGRGVWRLSYALAPKYWLLLRRGRIVKWRARQLAFSFEHRIDEDFAPVEQIESSRAAEAMEV